MIRFQSVLSFSFLLAFAACSATAVTVADTPDRDGQSASDGGIDAPADAVTKPTAADAAVDSRTQADAQTCATKTADCDLNGSCETNLLTGLQQRTASENLNCGACGTTCARTATRQEVCGAGQCLAQLDREVREVAADATAAYYLSLPTLGTLQLRSVAHASNTVTTLVADAQTQLPSGSRSLALSTDDVFVAVRGAAGTTVFRAPKTGGGFTLFGSDPDGLLGGNQEEGVAVSNGFVFWTSRLGVYRQALEGGAAELWKPTRCVKGLKATADKVFWSCYSGEITYGNASGTAATTTQISSGTGFTADATSLFYFGTDGIYAKPLSGGPGVRQISTTASSLLATNGVSFFWVNRQASPSNTIALLAGQLGGPAAEIVADNQVTHVVIGGRAVYFLQNGGGHLWRLP